MSDLPNPPAQNVDPDFDKEKEANGIKKTVATVFNSLANVQVITGIGDVSVTLHTGTGKIHSTVTTDGQDFKAFVTQFNLVDGDIVSALPTTYEKHASVQSLHEANVKQGIKVLPSNLSALVGVAESIITLIND